MKIFICVRVQRGRRQKIECKESLAESDYKLILNSNYPYTAVVKDELLDSLISRDRVALLVARNLAKPGISDC